MSVVFLRGKGGRRPTVPLPSKPMKPLMAITAQALQRVGVVHVKAQPFVVWVVDHESMPTAALLAAASSIVLDLQGYQVPITRVQEVFVLHGPDRSGNLVFVGAAGFRDHAVKPETFLHFPGSKVLLNEGVCLIIRCLSHQLDRLKVWPSLTVKALSCLSS